MKLNWGAPLTVGNFTKLEGNQDATFVGKGVRRSQIDFCKWRRPYLWYKDLERDLELIDLSSSGQQVQKGPFTKWNIYPVHSQTNLNTYDKSSMKQIPSEVLPKQQTSATSVDQLQFIINHIPHLNHFFDNQTSIITLELFSIAQRNELISSFFLSKGSDDIIFHILLCIIALSLAASQKTTNTFESSKDHIKSIQTYLIGGVPKFPKSLRSSNEELLLTLLIILSQASPEPIVPSIESLYTHSPPHNRYTLYTHFQFLYLLNTPTKYDITRSTYLLRSSKFIALYSDYLDPEYNLLTNLKTVISGTVYDEGRGDGGTMLLNNAYEKIEIKLQDAVGNVGADEYKPKFSINFFNSVKQNTTTTNDNDNSHSTIDRNPIQISQSSIQGDKDKLDIYQYIKTEYQKSCHNDSRHSTARMLNLSPFLLLAFSELSQLVLQTQYFQRNKFTTNFGHARNFPKVCKEFFQLLKDCEVKKPKSSSTETITEQSKVERRDYKFYQFLLLWYYRCIERYPLKMLRWHVEQIAGLETEYAFVKDLMLAIGVKYDVNQDEKQVGSASAVWMP